MGWNTVKLALGVPLLAVFAYLAYLRLYLMNFRHSRDFNSINDRPGQPQMIVEGLDVLSRNSEALLEFQNSMYTRTLSGEPPLKSKIIVLTGATKGLGRGLAAHMAAWGASLVLPCRRCDHAQLVDQVRSDAKQVLKRYGKARDPGILDSYFAEPRVFDMDLADLDQIDAFVEWYQGLKLGPADFLVNNAGLVSVPVATTKQGFEITFGVNFLASAYLTDKFLKQNLVREKISVVSSEDHRVSSRTIEERLNEHKIRFGQVWGSGFVDALERYDWSKLAQTTYFQGLMRTSRVPIVELCPGPVASDIAQNVIWPINVIVKVALDLMFPAIWDAAIPVARLTLGPNFKNAHYHIAEERPARGDARDQELQDKVISWTEELMRTKRPPQ